MKRPRPGLFFLLAVLGAAACARVPYTGRLQLSLGNAGEEKEVATVAARQLARETRLVTSGAEAERVERVGEKIARAAALPGPDDTSPEQFNWRFHTVRDKEANAFSLPDGSIFVNTDLLEMTRSDDELAGVIGHEAAHVLAHHSAERSGSETLSGTLQEVGSLALSMTSLGQFGGVFSTVWSAGSKYGVLLPFSREQEMEADYIGLVLATRAGYAPEATLAFWKRMAAQNMGDTGAQWRSTHPSDETRLENLEKILPEMDRWRPDEKGSGQRE